MKTAKKRRRTTNEASVTQNNVDISTGSVISKTPTEKPSGFRCTKTGRSNTCLDEKENHSPFKSQALPQQLQVIGTSLPERTNPVSTLEKEPKQASQSPAKIKLQLFPIDLSTQKALEKGGHNPHLELILNKHKKISSVARHLKSKWGSACNVGEIVLFPYNIQLENLAGYRRWTSEDTDTSAADVYQAIGRPTVFRLRYGWSPNVESKNLRAPPISSRYEDSIQMENIKQAGIRDDENAECEKQSVKFVSKECTPNSTADSVTATKDIVIQADREYGPLDNPRIGARGDESAEFENQPVNIVSNECISISLNAEQVVQADTVNGPPGNPRTGQGLAPSSSIWADSMSNISLGALLSEASSKDANNQTDPVAVRSDLCLQQIPFSCDSFDAAIAAHIYRHSEIPQRVSNDSHSSFLDAEETCHAFPRQNFASGKDVITSSGSAPISSIQEVNIPAGITQNQDAQEAKTDSSINAQGTDNGSSSLGLTGINWNDSLSAFDLGLSSRRLVSGDSISLSGFLANSMDAFQNFTLFARDTNVAPS